MYKGKELSYDDLWNFFKENSDLWWRIIAVGGSQGMFTKINSLYRPVEILDENDEVDCKMIHFNDMDKKKSFSLSKWESYEYDIRVHNTQPLEILVDWFDTHDCERGIYIFRDEKGDL